MGISPFNFLEDSLWFLDYVFELEEKGEVVAEEGVTSHVTRDTQVCSYQISPPWEHLTIQFVRTTFY